MTTCYPLERNAPSKFGIKHLGSDGGADGPSRPLPLGRYRRGFRQSVHAPNRLASLFQRSIILFGAAIDLNPVHLQEGLGVFEYALDPVLSSDLAPEMAIL